ncbi:hypothetical protein WA158_007806 [Blastocystis sp. Blastoise]
MMKLIVLVLLIFIVGTFSTILQPSDYADVQSTKCLSDVSVGGGSSSGNTYTVNATYTRNFPCYDDRRPECDSPFPASIAYAVADTVTETYINFHHDRRRRDFRLDPQDFLDCYTHYILNNFTKEDLAHISVADALDYVEIYGILPYCQRNDHNHIHGIVVDYPDPDRCDTDRRRAIRINGYYYISPSQVKNLFRHFQMGPVILSLALETVGNNSNPPVYPSRSHPNVPATPPDSFCNWEDKDNEDQRCENSYSNDITAFQEPGYCPTFTYFARMTRYTIHQNEYSADNWEIESCTYRRKTSEITTCNAFNRFSPDWQSIHQYTDTAYLTYGAYQPYIDDPCHASVNPNDFTLSDDEIDFMEREKLLYCHLCTIDTLTIHGYDDEELLMFAHILQYNFQHNTKHLTEHDTTGHWNLHELHIHNDNALFGREITSASQPALDIIRSILCDALITADNFDIGFYASPDNNQHNLRG